MVWVCGSFAFVLIVIVVSTALVQFRRTRRGALNNTSEDNAILTQNMEN